MEIEKTKERRKKGRRVRDGISQGYWIAWGVSGYEIMKFKLNYHIW